MGQELNDMPPAVVPFLASLRWYSFFFRALVSGLDEHAARVYANEALHVAGKDFSRTTLCNGMRLKVPLEGSSSARRLSPELMTVSGHGDWRHAHTGALVARFGRSPFFPHLFPGLENVLSLYGDAGSSLSDLSGRLHEVVAAFVGIADGASAYRGLPSRERDLARRRGLELYGGFKADESFLQVAMCLGPDAIFLLVAALTQEKHE